MTALDQYRIEERRKRKGPLGCFFACIIMLLVVLGVTGFFGYQLYSSAKQVRAEARWMMDQVDPLKAAVKTGDEEALDLIVSQLVEKADWMYD